MEPQFACSDCLLGVARNILCLMNAKICSLSVVEDKSIIPVAVAGAHKNEFDHDFLEQELPEQTLSIDSEQPYKILKVATVLNRANRFLKMHNIKQHAQILFRVDCDNHILVSLFYEQTGTIEQRKLDKIAEILPCFKVPVITVTKSVHISPRETGAGFENIIGKSKSMQNIFHLIRLVAKTNANVFIVGETGTGKELIARAIHRNSDCRDSGFIPVDCVAIPKNLLESELFGFEKGTFSGAINRKYGLLEFAHKGTLFLDEISELDFNLQSKLLRVLQERQFRRIGGETLINVDMRVIAATNRNRKEIISEGHLRKDLFYRLHVIPIQVPPLRQRREDIPLLVTHFLRRAIKKNRLAPKHISSQAMERLMKYQWPGNIRQLQNMIERLSLLSPNPVIEVADLPKHIQSAEEGLLPLTRPLPLRQARKEYLDKFEKRYLQEILQKTDHNIERAAKLAQVSSRTIYRLIERWDS